MQLNQINLNSRLCFVVMPFDEALQNVYDTIETVVEDKCGLVCMRADKLTIPERITEDIWNCISEARVLIADLTGRNANVFYEVGLAHALGKQVILLVQKQEEVPFDLREIRYLNYDSHDLMGLRRDLLPYIKSCVSTVPKDWSRNFRPSDWDGAYVKITSLEAPPIISVGQPFEITLKAKNNGRPARQGYFSVSFPDGVDKLSVESSADTRVGMKGDLWKADAIVLDYPIAEGFKFGDGPVWPGGKEFYIKVTGYAKRKGFLWFYINACCCDAGTDRWAADPQEQLMDVDQRGENVYCGLIEVV